MKKMFCYILILTMFSMGIAWAGGTFPTHHFGFKPQLTTQGTSDKANFDIGINNIDTRLGKVVYVTDPLYGATGNGTTDDTAAVQAAYDAAALVQGSLIFPSGIYRCNLVTTSNKVDIIGMGPQKSILKSATSNGFVITQHTSVDAPNDWSRYKIKGLGFEGAVGTVLTSGGIQWSVAADSLYGRVDVEQCFFDNLNTAVYKQFGNFGNKIVDNDFETCNYHYYAEANGVVSQGGTDFINNNQFRGAQIASQFINNPSAQHTYNHNVFEANPGFVFFVYNYSTTGIIGNPGIKVSNCYLETNATLGSVSVLISGVPTAETPVAYYLRNCPNFVLDSTPLSTMTLVNSIVTAGNVDDEKLGLASSLITKDANSAVIVNSLNVFASTSLDMFVQSISRATQQTGQANTTRVWTSPRRAITRDATAAKYVDTLANADTYGFSDGVNPYTGTTVADGVIFDSCCEIAVPASTTIFRSPHSGIQNAIPLNDWIVWSFDALRVSGGDTKFYLNGITDVAGFSIKDPATFPGWHTYAGVTKNIVSNPLPVGSGALFLIGDGTGGTVRVSAIQVVSFAREEDALAYFDSGTYCAAGDIPRIIYSSSAPTTGTWTVNDICIRTPRVIGQPKGWSCTTAGTPGVWTSEGNL